MGINDISLNKKLLILGLFLFFCLIIIFATIYSTTKKPRPSGNGEATPTRVPIVIPQNSNNTLPKSQIQTSSSTNTNSLGRVSFVIPSYSLPKTGTLYNISPSSIPTDTINKIKEKLVPGGTEKNIETPSGQVVMFTEGQKTLAIYTYSRTVSYTNSGTIISLDQIPFVEKARNFINSLSLAIDNTDPQIGYYSTKTSDLVEVNNFNDSDVVDVSFREAVNNIVIYRQFGSDSRTHVWITKKGDITKFTYLYSPVYEAATTVILPTLDEAQEMILKNKGTIVSIGNNYQQGLLEDPESTLFSNVSFGYFNDNKNKVLYPIFVFSGKSAIKGIDYPIVVYLPIDGGR